MKSIVCMLLAVFSVASFEAYAQTSPIELLETNFEVLADADEKTTLIPISYDKKLDFKGMHFEVFGVSLEARHDPAFRNAFNIDLAEDRQALMLTVTLSSAMRPGTYSIRFGVLRKDEVLQKSSINLVLPAATVNLPTSVVIHQVRGLRGDTLEGKELTIFESSLRSRLTGVTVRQLRVDAPETAPDGLTLNYPKSGLIPPGGKASLTGSLGGPFPLGTVSGQLELSATELAAPVQVPFQVKTRRVHWALWLTLAAGLVFGYLMRTKLQSIIQMSELRVQVADVLRQLQARLNEYKDTRFQEALEPHRGDLQAALSIKDPESVQATVKAAEAELKKALENLVANKKAAQTRLDGLAKTVATPWSLPDDIQSLIVDARTRVQAAQTDIDSGDPASAEKALTALAGDFAESLRNPTKDWKRKLLDLLAILERDGQPKPMPLTEELDLAVKDARTAAGALPVDTTRIDTAALLAGIHGVRTKIGNLAEQGRRRIRLVVNDVLEELPDGQPAAVLRGSIDNLDEKAESVGYKPEALLEILMASSDELQELLRVAILHGVPSGQPDITSLLAKGEYVQAAVKAKAARAASATQAPSPTGVFLGPVPGGAGGFSGSASGMGSGQPWGGVSGPAAAVLERELRPILSPADVDLVRARAWGAQMRAKSLQTILAGLGILVAGYLLFIGDFVGTPKNIAAAFLWAYGLDVGLDALTEATKKLKTS